MELVIIGFIIAIFSFLGLDVIGKEHEDDHDYRISCDCSRYRKSWKMNVLIAILCTAIMPFMASVIYLIIDWALQLGSPVGSELFRLKDITYVKVLIGAIIILLFIIQINSKTSDIYRLAKSVFDRDSKALRDLIEQNEWYNTKKEVVKASYKFPDQS